MNPATPAPAFARIYASLAEIARANGYALAVHGSMTRDLDLVAIPWTDEAVSALDLIAALRTGIATIGQDGPTPKPHGRYAWNLHLFDGSTLDVSVMQRAQGGL